MKNGGKEGLLFLCIGNSCRSQMAEGWARHLLGKRFRVQSAGSRPKGLDPRAVRVMREVGIDISTQTSKSVDDLHDDYEYVITVCGGGDAACPYFPALLKTLHRPFEDPPALAEGLSEEEALAAYRKVRDEIGSFVEALPEALYEDSSDTGNSVRII